jgi:hypothetical protein
MKTFYLAVLLVMGSYSALSQKKMVAIGSSTTAGQGTFPLDSSWVNRFNHYYKYVQHVLDSTYNLGVGGYSCYKGMPNNYVPPPNRPGPDPSHNVSLAVTFLSSLSNGIDGTIIVNYPTNGYDTFTVAEVMSSLQLIYDSATKKGYACYVTTTQPRSDAANHFNNSAAKRKLAVLKDSILNRFGSHAIDFYTGMINPADSTIAARYSAGDSIHYNNAGHGELWNRVLAKDVPNLGPLPLRITQFNGAVQIKQVVLTWTSQDTDPTATFTVQYSTDGVNYQSLQSIVPKKGSLENTYQYVDRNPANGLNYYRLQVNNTTGKYYSSVILIKYAGQPVVVKKLFPVPASKFIYLDIVSPARQTLSIDILNSSGIRVKTKSFTPGNSESIIPIAINELPSGTYFMRIHSAGGESIIQQFVK